MTPTVDVLRRARALLTAETWRGAPSENNRGRISLVVALSRGGYHLSDKDFERVFFAAQDALKRAAGCESIVDWNDTPGRTLAEVWGLIDRAVEEERKR